jgi:hypothetical protein
MRFPVAILLAGILALFSAAAAGGYPQEGKDKKRPAQFLIFGTVFTQQGFSLPGAEVKIRKAGEKKVRGEAYSDRRGEFAIRVAPGAEYEVTVTARGFERQVLKVSATGSSREDLVFRMKPEEGGKKQ